MSSQKTFRLFISSTFSDLVEERNILQNEVFVEVKAYCKAFGYGFEAIDLRWGVNDEASLDHKAMQICIHEVEKVVHYPKPNFLVMLGDRYGWIPVATEIEATYFELLMRRVDLRQIQLLEKWYKKDTNAIPECYILQPIEGTPVHQKSWSEDEIKLKEIIVQHKEIFPQDLYIGKSATEQEIIKGVLTPAETMQDKDAHVLCMVRKIVNGEKIESDLFVEDDQVQLEHLKEQLKVCKAPDVEYVELAATLKKKEDVYKPDKEYLEDYAIVVKKFLIENISREMERLRDAQVETENTLHQQFKEGRAQVFVGREALITQVKGYIEDENNRASFVLYGESGVGKSALMAKMVTAVEASYKNENNITLLYRFVGISEVSSQPKLFLDNLIGMLQELLNQKGKETSKTYTQSVNTFISLIAQYSENHDKKLVIFMDALDQFESKTSLEWLEVLLPPKVKIILSTLPSEYGEYYNLLKAKVPRENMLEVERLPLEDVHKIVDTWLKVHKRALTKEQLTHILALFEHNGLPLYMKIIFDQALQWHSYDTAYRQLNDKSLQDAIRSYFKSLVTHNHHAKSLVEHTLGYISASKKGLSEGELVDVLSSDYIVVRDIANPFHKLPSSPNINKLPAAVWSRLYYDLLKYFTYVEFDGISLINFYHRKIKENSRDFYYHLNREFYHTNLLEFFWNQPLRYKETGAINLRKLSELPYHCIGSCSYSKFLDLYTDEFMEQKLKYGQKEVMLDELFELANSVLDNKVISKILQDEVVNKLVNTLHTFLLHSIKDPTSKVLSVEDIHASYMFRRDLRFYTTFLSIVTKTKDLEHAVKDKQLLISYKTAFKARNGNMLRRDARLEEAGAVYEEMISSGNINTLHVLEQSTILYDVGTIAYLQGHPAKALKYLQESADVAGELNDGISRCMSLVKHGQIRLVYYNDVNFFKPVLDAAFKMFWAFRLSNLSAKRFVKNLYALYFDLYYVAENLEEMKKYLEKFKNDPTTVYKSICYVPKDPQKYITTGCTGFTPYEARIKMLEGDYKSAAEMFKRYINDFIDEGDRVTLEFIAKEYYDYLIALKVSGQDEAYEREYLNALELPDEPLNAIWKERIHSYKKH